MTIEFSQWVNNHHFTLKCLPKTEPRQVITHVKTRCNAYEYAFGQDCFGNRTIYGFIDQPHQMLDLMMECKACVDWQEYDTDANLNPIFKKQTPFTEPQGQLLDFAKKCKETCPVTRPFDVGFWLMHLIHDSLHYQKGVTDVNTPASIAYQQRKGVCQDYAHIMLSVLRYMDIPCRYVAGAMKDESLTHAWIELYSDGKWYGLDPTNDLLVSDIYITFSRGRDAKDCLVNEGVFYGLQAKQKQTIELSVEELND